jgi:hypothetical protein
MEATIKTASYALACTVIGIIFTGCAITTGSIVTDYDRDARFNTYQTFYWSDDFQMENGKVNDPLFYNTLIKKRLKKAITDEMTGRGYQLNAKDPDLLINTHVLVEQTSTSQNNLGYPYFGYYYWGSPGSMTTTQRKQGALVIELIDKDRHQLVWQGYAPDVLQTNTEDKQREIRDAVSKIFAKYEL